MKRSDNQPIDVYTDGSCMPNPGPGGWGVYAVVDGKKREWSGELPEETSNNRMELMAAIKALEMLPNDRPIIINSDSDYLVTGITNWVTNWKRNGWRTAARKTVKNQDLWKILDAAADGREVKWQWIEGHAGNRGNAQAHNLAHQAAMHASIRFLGAAPRTD